MEFIDERGTAVHAELLVNIAAVGDRCVFAHAQMFGEFGARPPGEIRTGQDDVLPGRALRLAAFEPAFRVP